MSIRVYWKIYRTIDTKKDSNGNDIIVSEKKGFFGKTAGASKSKLLTLEQLQEHDKAKILPEDDEEKLWTLVDICLQLGIAHDDQGYLSNQEEKKHSYNNIGNFWKHAVELGWDPDEAWDIYEQKRSWVHKQARSLIDQQFENAPDGAEKPTIHATSTLIPAEDITTKTQASAKTKLGRRLGAHFEKKGKLVVAPKKSKKANKKK